MVERFRVQLQLKRGAKPMKIQNAGGRDVNDEMTNGLAERSNTRVDSQEETLVRSRSG